MRCLAVVAALLLSHATAAQSETPTEIQIEVERFGVGGTIRPGDWTGVRIRINDSAPKAREVALRLSPRVDPDGDEPIFQRDVTTNPGQWQGAWLYWRVPHWFDSTDVIVISAYEALESGSTDRTGAIAVSTAPVGRLLGQVRVTPKGFAPADVGLLGMVGNRPMSLTRYAVRNQGERWRVLGHELQEYVAMTPAELPDRWMGYAPFESIVWGVGEPGEVRGERAVALKDWINRGGHLIIVLPPVGENWTNPSASELHELLPRVTVRRREGIDLERYRPLLVDSRKTRLPKETVVHEFTPMPDAARGEAIRVFDGPDSECVVARRLVGLGMVTVVGLDLAHRTLLEQELPLSDVFWNRVLGQRGELPSPQEAEAIRAQNFLSRSGVNFATDIPGEIAKTRTAAAGVLLGFVVFVAYWLIAGPLGYAILKRRSQVQHSWLAYALAALAFTGIAWGGATMIRPRKVEAQHLSFIDHVFGQPLQRARTWVSILIPWYGQATVQVTTPTPDGSGPGKAEGIDLAAAWESIQDAKVGVGAFPDSRPYVVDARNPNAVRVPTRSTVKQWQVDWIGGPRWKMPVPVDDAGDASPSAAIRFNADRTIKALLTGKLKHELPGPLNDAVIIVVQRQASLVRSSADGPEPRPLTTNMICDARAYKLANPWQSGQVLDMSVVTASTDPSTLASRLMERLLGSQSTSTIQGATRSNPGQVVDHLTALSLFSQLDPPKRQRSDTSSFPAANRAGAQGLDLGKWFTQPCVIVIGAIGTTNEPAETPTPIFVDGQRVPTQGRTLVRWIYPMPDDPPSLSPPTDEAVPPGVPTERGG